MLLFFRYTRFRASSLLTCVALTLLPACGGGGNATMFLAGAAFPAGASRPAAIDPAFTMYENAVLATNPIAYFPFNLASQGSLVGGYTTSLLGGAKIAKPGAIKSDGRKNRYLSLSGMAYATTTLSGGIPGTGSMVAWVNLSELPSQTGTYFYVAGESEVANDFDVQFQNDNNLYFYTGAGENTKYVTNPNSLVGRWNMIAVTYVGNYYFGSRDIYWNGKLVVQYLGRVEHQPKVNQFNVGESLVFPGRYFQGGIDDVAVWGRALTATEIKTIYTAAK